MSNIPYQNMEIEQIYSQLMSEPGRSIAVCSANTGEGVTSITLALAQRNLLAGCSTLVVDLNLHRPALQNLLDIRTETTNLPSTPSSSIFATPQLVTVNKSALAVTGITAKIARENIIKLRQPGILEACIREWSKHFDNVLIDTSPLNRINAQNIPAERVAAACDGALLVVLAGQTSEAMLSSAVNKLKTAKAQLLGSVFNDRDNPSLKTELLREVQRLDSGFSWLSRPLKNFISNNQLLNTER